MVLWVTRNCEKLRVNDSYIWRPATPMETHENHAAFDSIVASWYYDGNRMREAFILDHGITETWWQDNRGGIRTKTEKGVYSFSGSPADFQLSLNNENVELELTIRRWNDAMAKLLPTAKTFSGNMGYSMLKYRALVSSGKVRIGEAETSLNGRCYFQKVRMSITPCWYWATVQWDNGSYLQYFLPHFGIPMLRRSTSHDSVMDWGEKMVSKTLRFYNADEDREYVMKDIKFSKRYDNGLPIFNVKASSDEAELSIETTTYARCCWKISQPLFGPIWHGIFYNEYPARVTRFKFKSGICTIGNDDFGKSYCNCEHTWGTV